MRTVFEEEEEVAPSDPRQMRGEDRGQDRELTISSTTLLAIFFGLVLICGLFFGLGYSLGRRTPSEASQLPSAVAATSDLQTTASVSKPSASSQPVETTPPVADPQTTDTSAANPEPQDDSTQARTEEAVISPAQSPVQQATRQTVKPALPQLAASVVPTSTVAASPTSTATPSGIATASGIMVQIAAISNPADADVLVSALQKRGYTASARHFSGDPLIHVQVGPFPNRADAIAMRQKLLNDGYNAILK